jgi:DnaJ-class molecular chaperone
VSDLAPTEIKALVRIMDELDYYQLMHVERGASARDVKKAYYAVSRSFHPDANRGLDADLRGAVERISKRITEAYTVLRDPRRRQAYDRQLDEENGVRMQLAAANAGAKKQAQENEGLTPQGRQYFRMASDEIKRQDWRSAERNLVTALTFEPGNETFKARLDEVRKHLKFSPADRR